MAVSTPVSAPAVAGATPTPVLMGWSGMHSDAYPVLLWEPVTLSTLTPVAGTVSAASTSAVGFSIVTRDAAGSTTVQFTGTFPAGATHASAATLGMPAMTLNVGDDIVCVQDGGMPSDGSGLVLSFVAA